MSNPFTPTQKKGGGGQKTPVRERNNAEEKLRKGNEKNSPLLKKKNWKFIDDEGEACRPSGKAGLSQKMGKGPTQKQKKCFWRAAGLAGKKHFHQKKGLEAFCGTD